MLTFGSNAPSWWFSTNGDILREAQETRRAHFVGSGFQPAAGLLPGVLGLDEVSHSPQSLERPRESLSSSAEVRTPGGSPAAG
jgi:hypothetical protein